MTPECGLFRNRGCSRTPPFNLLPRICVPPSSKYVRTKLSNLFTAPSESKSQGAAWFGIVSVCCQTRYFTLLILSSFLKFESVGVVQPTKVKFELCLLCIAYINFPDICAPGRKTALEVATPQPIDLIADHEDHVHPQL